MAEGGQTDDNLMRPDASLVPKIDRRPEWKAERGRMLRHIIKVTMAEMSDEEKHNRALHSVQESHIHLKDSELINAYERCGGKWTEIMMDKYRGKE